MESLLFLSREMELHIDVIKLPPQGSVRTLHSNCVSLERDVDIFQNVASLIAKKVFILVVDVAETFCLYYQALVESFIVVNACLSSI